ncbi:hypothetical protein MFIFM68171_11288 [Madurella fahalii]|uniref:Uncharacterized protein n=1 Tax=Madurella fahalii TaxID=1157608 RepID=A0ABQ0GTL0_9PEZI
MSEKQQERTSESATGNRTPVRDQRTVERQDDTGLDRQLAQQPPVQDRHLVRQQETAAAPTQNQDDHGGAPAVRLDMDLDVDVQLKAKIEGDITLSILDSDQYNRQRGLRNSPER